MNVEWNFNNSLIITIISTLQHFIIPRYTTFNRSYRPIKFQRVHRERLNGWGSVLELRCKESKEHEQNPYIIIGDTI